MTAEEALLTYNQMIVGIVEEEERADRLFGALANSTRRDIVRRTMKDDYSVSQLARCYTTSFAAIQKHVSILEAAGLVSKRSSGREQIVTGDINTIEDVHALLGQFEAIWRERLGRFDSVLNDSDPGGRR